ncbi:DUF7229 domain-containing protein [Streptomyces sp. MH60]|uniref:DUF7229 domain-containing protein n=1 Tax=Streptomyces sp. MH60 TaxID=1940758 RepID=UPI0010572B48|nr:hypothetical protein [Streptomyces sp. MH60]
MPPIAVEPIIMDAQGSERPPTEPNRRRNYELYDYQFPVEGSPKYAVADPTNPLRVPHFSVQDVACWVFAGRVSWLRHQLKGKPWKPIKGATRTTPLLLKGKRLKFRQVVGGRGGERRFTLPDIERLAWALYERNDIDGYDLQRICRILAAVADQYKAHRKEGE